MNHKIPTHILRAIQDIEDEDKDLLEQLATKGSYEHYEDYLDKVWAEHSKNVQNSETDE